jgi:hypothetical protein
LQREKMGESAQIKMPAAASRRTDRVNPTHHIDEKAQGRRSAGPAPLMRRIVREVPSPAHEHPILLPQLKQR